MMIPYVGTYGSVAVADACCRRGLLEGRSGGHCTYGPAYGAYVPR